MGPTGLAERFGFQWINLFIGHHYPDQSEFNQGPAGKMSGFNGPGNYPDQGNSLRDQGLAPNPNRFFEGGEKRLSAPMGCDSNGLIQLNFDWSSDRHNHLNVIGSPRSGFLNLGFWRIFTLFGSHGLKGWSLHPQDPKT